MIDYANFCTKYSQLSSIPSSPERRFRTASPCRRLFDELSTANSSRPANQIDAVASNAANLATNPSSSIRPISCLDTTDFIGNNNCNNNCSTATTTASLLLSEGIALGYQRRKSIQFNSQLNPQVSSTLASSFMDDLGFLSSNSANQNMSKKLALAQYDENANAFNINAMTSSDPVVVFSHPSSALDTASPMKSPQRTGSSVVRTPARLFQMKPCSITKKASHWNRKAPALPANKVIQPKQQQLRRTVSELPKPSSPSSAENGMIHSLACFDSLKDAIKRIEPATLVDVLDGRISGRFEKLLIVDCRYPYEFAGGHIPGAINVNTPEQIEQILFDPESEFAGKHVAIVFHCEFSSERAPRMALHVRNFDRQLNTANYPSLCYPEMYILEGGYKNFWSQFGEHCEPVNAYVPMRNPYFKEELKHHQRVKHAFRSGCHLSQHSVIKTNHPAKRSRSLQPVEANQMFEDLLNCINRSDTSHLFPSHAISQSKSLSSILPSELDFPSEMDTDD